MTIEELRAAFVTTYGLFRKALIARDFKALAEVAFFSEDLPPKKVKKALKKKADWLKLSAHGEDGMKFAALVELPDEVYAYVYTHRDPPETSMVMYAFRLFAKRDGRWKISADGANMRAFTAKPDEDVRERALGEIEADPSFWVPPESDVAVAVDVNLTGGTGRAVETPREEAPEAPEDDRSPDEGTEEEPEFTKPDHWDTVMGPFDPYLRADLHCFAYDCETEITINGVRLRYGGGNSHNQSLSGYKWGEQSEEPHVLTVGKNRIEIRCRGGGSPQFELMVDITLDNGVRIFRLITKRCPEAAYEAEFVIPGSPTEKLPEEELEPVVLRDN